MTPDRPHNRPKAAKGQVDAACGHSRAFFLAARRCNEFRPLPDGLLQFLEVPSLVLYAFSIEVGFKALHLENVGEAPRKVHDLKDLFLGLPGDVQASIRADASSTYPDSEPRFESDLAIVNDAFNFWRYSYEGDPKDTDLGFLQRLAVAVQRALPSQPRGGST